MATEYCNIIDSELGDEELIQNAPLIAMVYDRPGKGDDLVIEVGQDEVTYAHTINFYKIDPSKNSYLNQLSKLQTMSAIALILFAIAEMALFMAIVRLFV
ncbi:hypothetical protein [Nostoc sp.]|uniref:hypothetical protein n=1 Tax=Nostoc sp. TaxID=1180 RepID=UPI002FF6E1B5